MVEYELNQYSQSSLPSFHASLPESPIRPDFDYVGNNESERHLGESIVRDESNLDQTNEGAPLPGKTISDANDEGNQEYATGLKLFSILASVTMAAFLMLLDGSIIGVVSCQTHCRTRDRC